MELLSAGRRAVKRVMIAQGQEPSPLLDEIERLALARSVPIASVTKGRIEAQASTFAPQGVVALAEPVEATPLEVMLGSFHADPFILVAAGVVDPQNLGSLLRSAAGAGVGGVVLASHRATLLSPAVVKVAAGAVEHLEFCLVPGIAGALLKMSRLGVSAIGLAAEAASSLYELDAPVSSLALVVGGENKGLPRLVRERCDRIVKIPQHGGVPSLNVAAAGAVACFELARRRTTQPSRARRPGPQSPGAKPRDGAQRRTEPVVGFEPTT